MKTKNLIVAVVILLCCTSCIVKSLHPFYTQKTVIKDDRFLGKWKDKSGETWEVVPLKKLVKKDKKDGILLEKDQKQFLKKYKNGYLVRYNNKEVSSYFIAVPFKINNQVFLDFTPFDIDDDEKINKLKSYHAVYTHSLVKFDVLDDQKISIKWLDESRIKKLFTTKKIKIKHEKIGVFENKYLLTATPEELQEFIKKYMTSSNANKWETDVKFTLTKTKGKPFADID